MIIVLRRHSFLSNHNSIFAIPALYIYFLLDFGIRYFVDFKIIQNCSNNQKMQENERINNFYDFLCNSYEIHYGKLFKGWIDSCY